VNIDAQCNPGVSALLSPYEQWAITANDEIINNGTGLCLTDPGSTNVGGTALELKTCASSIATDQQWTAPYDRPTAQGPVKSQISAVNLCLDDANDATTNGNKIQVWNCLGNANQDWTITSSGTLQLHGQDGCATPSNDGTVNATPIVYETCDGDNSQQWTEQSDGSLLNTRSGLCLSDPDASTTNGTATQLSPCNNQVQQTWTLP
jgi:hypothetical protein